MLTARFSSELEMVLALVHLVVNDAKKLATGKVVTCKDCSKEWEMIASENVKASQLSRDGDYCMSAILQLE